MICETYLEDCEIGARRQLCARALTEKDLVVHAGHGREFFAHHTDKGRCAADSLEERISQGTVILTTGAGPTTAAINPAAFGAGHHKPRLLRPVRSGDTIHREAEVKGKSHDKKTTLRAA